MEVSYMAKSRITPEQKARRAQLGQLMEGAGIKSMNERPLRVRHGQTVRILLPLQPRQESRTLLSCQF